METTPNKSQGRSRTVKVLKTGVSVVLLIATVGFFSTYGYHKVHNPGMWDWLLTAGLLVMGGLNYKYPEGRFERIFGAVMFVIGIVLVIFGILDSI